jgi:hypothetical protein
MYSARTRSSVTGPRVCGRPAQPRRAFHFRGSGLDVYSGFRILDMNPSTGNVSAQATVFCLLQVFHYPLCRVCCRSWPSSYSRGGEDAWVLRKQTVRHRMTFFTRGQRPQRSPALLLHRTTPPVDLESVRERTAALLGPLFRFDFGKAPPAPDLQKTVKPPRVRFDFALKRATWRTVRSAQPTTRVPVPSGGQIDLEGAWVPPHAHVS